MRELIRAAVIGGCFMDPVEELAEMSFFDLKDFVRRAQAIGFPTSILAITGAQRKPDRRIDIVRVEICSSVRRCCHYPAAMLAPCSGVRIAVVPTRFYLLVAR